MPQQTKIENKSMKEEELRKKFEEIFWDWFIPLENGIPNKDKAQKVRVCNQKYINMALAHRKAELEEIMEEIEKKKQQLIQWGVKQPNWIIVFTDILQIIKSKI